MSETTTGLPLDLPQATLVRIVPDAEEIRQEVAAEVPTDLPVGVTEISLAGERVRVIPVVDWYTRANTALQNEDMDEWARLSLFENDYQEVWCKVNDGNGPRNKEVLAMFKEWGQKTGQGSPGK